MQKPRWAEWKPGKKFGRIVGDLREEMPLRIKI